MTVHDDLAEKLAKKFHTEYKSNKGIDIVTPSRVIEVETKKGGVPQGIKQVIHSDKARYLAVNKMNLDAAINQTKGTGIGVMIGTRIVKKAGRN